MAPTDPQRTSTDGRTGSADGAGASSAAADVADETAQRAVRVTADRILCGTRSDGEKRSRGGILIPATATSTDRTGVWADVIDVGPLVRTTEAGDKVLFLPEVAIEVTIHGEEYLIVRERDVHAIASAAQDAAGTGLYL